MAKWAGYVVLPGLIPVILRVLIAGIAQDSTGFTWFQPTDVIAFGLILLVANISIIERDHRLKHSWRTSMITLSIFIIVLLAALFAASCISEIARNTLDHRKLLIAATLLSVASLALSYVVWERLASLDMLEVDQ